MAKAKIIIIEDDIDNLDFLCCELFDFYELHPISDEQFTIGDFEKIRPNLIILDTDMQNIDIFSLYRLLKENPTLAKVPVLFAINKDNIAHKKNLADLKIESYVHKPFNALKLKAAINKLLP